MRKQINVYTARACRYCRQVKRSLTDRSIQYRLVDVSADKAAAIEIVERPGQLGVSVIDVGGALVVGFNRARLEQLLQAG